MARESDFMFILAWAVTFIGLVGGVWIVWWITSRRSPIRGALRWFFIGDSGEDIGPRGVPLKKSPRGYFVSEPSAASDFVTGFRLPNDRIKLRYDAHEVVLTARGTNMVTMLVAADERTGATVRRQAQRGAYRDRRRTPTHVNPEVGDGTAGSRFLESWLSTRGPMVAMIGTAEVTLTSEGSDIVAGVLAGSHKTVDRIAHALGSEPRLGWADWVPSDRVEFDVTHDSYLDGDANGWVEGRRPAFGGKQTRYRE